MRYFTRKILCGAAFVVSCITINTSYSQELIANVEVLHNRVQNVDAKVFASLKTSMTEFINNRRWTQDVFQANEKIQCSFFINVTETVGNPEDNLFRGTITVQATRPVFNTNYTTTLINHLDRDFTFKFDPSQVLLFDENRVAGNDPLVANLPAIVAYYVYMILGFDYDSFGLKGGDPYFKKAQNIAMNAPEDARLINGWKASEANRRNRYWFVDHVLNPRFSDMRTFWYEYHIKGLDVMRSKPEEAINSIMPYFEKLKQINQENPSSMYTMAVFNAKSGEFANIVSRFPMEQKEAVKNILAEIDVPNAAKYKNIK